ERIFKTAMAPLALDVDVEPADAALFTRFWENRASVSGREWDRIWDDPANPPDIGAEVIALALRELDEASRWAERSGGRDGEERVRQLRADKAKWLAKAGRFEEAWALAPPSGAKSYAAHVDRLLLLTLEHISADRLAEAARTADELAAICALH